MEEKMYFLHLVKVQILILCSILYIMLLTINFGIHTTKQLGKRIYA